MNCGEKRNNKMKEKASEIFFMNRFLLSVAKKLVPRFKTENRIFAGFIALFLK
jgi:hypothetical protein